jgi:hypothetical protein
VNRSEANESLRALHKRAHAELQQLKDRQHRLERLIEFIDEYGAGKPKRARKRRQVRARSPSLLEVIGDRPGVRKSMLAMVMDRSPEEVGAELEYLEREGSIRRDGLGWSRADQ